MAASPGAEEDSVYDTGRLSLFDIILEKTRAQNKVKKTSSHFCILISFCRKITVNYPSKAHLICKCLQVETVIWRLSDALWAYILIWLQKLLVHRLVYVSKIRQDVNDRKEIGGRLLLTV